MTRIFLADRPSASTFKQTIDLFAIENQIIIASNFVVVMQLKIQINEKQGVDPSTQHEAVKNQHTRHNITFEWLRLSSHKSHKSHITGVYSAFAMNAALNIVTCP